MRRITLAVAALGAALLPLATRGPAHAATKHTFSVTVTDDLGFTVHFRSVPKRIISLDPRDTESLFALGVEKKVVADGSKYAEGAAGIKGDFKYPAQWPSKLGRDYPVKSVALPHIEGGCCGTPFDLELIESLRPDLVVALNTDAPTLQKMRDLGIKVVVLDPANFKGILRDIRLLGKITGTTKQARAVTSTMAAEVSTVKKDLKSVKSRPSVYYELDASDPTKPYTAGPGTFIDEAIHIAHGQNVADSVTTCGGKDCYPQLNLEALVQMNPQIILLGDAAYGVTVASVKTRTGWSTVSAVQTGKIYPFDDQLLSRAGPRFPVGLLELAKRVHPEAFKK